MKVRKISKKKWLILSITLIAALTVIMFFLIQVYRKKPSYSKIPVTTGPYFMPIEIKGFSSAHIPYLQMEIEGKTATLEIDLGYSGWVSLSSEFLSQLNQKSFIKQKSICGLAGKKHECSVYKIPEMKIGNVAFTQIEAEENNTEFETEITLQTEKNKTMDDVNVMGSLGWYLFSYFNVLVDCEHSTLALCDSLETLKQQGYPVESFTETPLLLDHDSIDFEAITKDGPLRCTLDTGSTWNLLNKDLEGGSNNHMIFRSNNGDQHSDLNPDNKNLMVFNPKEIYEMPIFKIGDKDFGPITFNRIKSPLAIDSVISMEFFESTLIFIDFSHSKLYFFEPPSTEDILKLDE